MSTAVPPQPPASSRHTYEVRPTAESHFSWLRTAVSMIGFGFTIVQFFERFHDMAGVKAAEHPEAPRYLGLMLIAAGTLALVIAVAQYHTLVKYLWTDTFRPITPDRHTLTPTYAASIVLIGIGLFAFFAVAGRMV